MSWHATYLKIIDPIDWFRISKIPALKEMSSKNSLEIKDILEGISTIPLEKIYHDFGDYVYVAPFRRIKENRDFARVEFLGAIQRYLMGFYDDSIIRSTSAVEASLLTVHLERIKAGLMPSDIKKPFTFGKSIKLAIDNSRGFVFDKEIASDLDEILHIRNSFVHQYNFISTLIALFKKKIEKNAGKFDRLERELLSISKGSSDVASELKKRGVEIKGDTKLLFDIIDPELRRLLLQDLIETSKNYKNLSDFSVFSSEDYLDFNKHLVEEFGPDIFGNLAKYTIKKSYKIMKFLNYY
jgi:hypothetical protein